MTNQEYMDIRQLMAQRGTRGGENKRLPVVLVSKHRADHLDEVEERLKKVQMILPAAIAVIAFIAGMSM